MENHLSFCCVFNVNVLIREGFLLVKMNTQEYIKQLKCFCFYLPKLIWPWIIQIWSRNSFQTLCKW